MGVRFANIAARDSGDSNTEIGSNAPQVIIYYQEFIFRASRVCLFKCSEVLKARCKDHNVNSFRSYCKISNYSRLTQ